MQSQLAIRSTLGFLATLLLAACGGGGGGSSGGGGTELLTINTSPSPPSGTVNAAYAGFTFSVATGGAAPFSWSESGALPPGLAFNSNGQLSGVPTTAGTYPITVTVTDSSTPRRAATASVSLVIAEPGDVVVASATPPDGTVSYAYSGIQFGATGGIPPYVWSITGTVPPGLTLSPYGQLSGTPTTAGSWTFMVVATDSETTPKAGSQSVTVVIRRPADVAINPVTTLPAGVHGTPYPGFSFSATGGELPLRWSATGAVPPGLTVDSGGVLSGTPAAAGSFTFTVTVADNASTPTMASAHFTVVITEPLPPTITAAPPPTGTVGVAYPAFGFHASGGLAPLVWSATGTLAGLVFSLDGVLSGTPVEAGHFPIMVNVKDAINQTATPVPVTIRVSLNRPAAAFTATGSMTVPRSGHTATRLPDGKVLVAGGPGASAELYDPASGVFTATGSMAVARSGHTATLLTDAALPNHGKVLMVGGDATGMSVELYDPATGAFAATGSLAVARHGHTATLLSTGKVLVAGGGTATAELYDPASGTFTATGSMSIARGQHTATLLLDGTVLIAGGGTATAELYDPVTGRFTTTGSMNETRTGATAARLQDGTVLIAGPLATAELYDPATRTFSLVGDLLHSAQGATASLLNHGTVIVAGGVRPVLVSTKFCRPTCQWISDGVALVSVASADLFAPESQGFTLTGTLGTARDGHVATVLDDGAVLITGGTQHRVTRLYSQGWHTVRAAPVVLSSAELYR